MSSRHGGRSMWYERQLFCPSRYASIRTLGEPSLLWLGAYDEIRLFQPKALQSSERSSLRVDQVYLRSRLMLDPKRYLGQQPWPSATLGRLAAALGIFTSSSLVCAPSPLRLSCLPPLFAPIGVVERIVDLSANPQAVQEYTELSGHGYHRPFLGVLPAPRGYLLSVALRSESFPTDPGCSGRCLP